MRLLLTAVGVDGTRDVAVECADDATVADVARALAEQAEYAVASVVRPVQGTPLGLVQPDHAPPPLWWRGEQLDPDLTVAASPLRHGAIVGLGHPVADELAEPNGTVELRVTSGAGAGLVRRLAPGSYPLGSGIGSVVPLADPSVPPVAAWLDVDATGAATVRPDPSCVGRLRPAPYRQRPLDGPIVVPNAQASQRVGWWRRRKRTKEQMRTLLAGDHDEIDPQQDVPVLHLERRAVDAPTRWQPGQLLAVGRTLLTLAPVHGADASLSPTAAGATLDYNRPPRLLPAPRVTTFSLPSEPRKPERLPIPIVMVLAPAAMAGGMYWFTKSPLSLMFAGLTPLMAISTYTTGRRTARRQYREQVADYGRRKRRVQEDAYRALVDERTQRRRDLADPAELLVTATGPRTRLWERRPTDPDWLYARVGTADVISEVEVRDPEREIHEGPVVWTAPDVPVAVPLAAVGVTGVAGPDSVRRAIGSWIVAQAAVLHSPADLDIVLLADPAAGPAWAWLRWLPHARPADGTGPIALAGADDDAVQGLVRGLLAQLQARQAAKAGSSSRQEFVPDPVLVVLDGARRLRLLPGMVSLLQEGPAVGMYFLCLDADSRQLPEECRAVVSVTDGNTLDLRVAVSGQPDVDGVRPDLVDAAWCERVARALAPIRDVSGEDLAGSLPNSSRLLDVLGLPVPDAQQIVDRWRLGGRTTRAVIGEGLDGAFAIDIRRDGPHGLVAGTTGSGKSELLQTLIASLAVGNRPDEFTFVLIDYKGGAAFKDCDHLPHTVGMVTDLDGHLTTRALESLAAELRRREHQLAAAGAKDVEDYNGQRDAGDPRASEPMPRLLIVIDEFAALVAELPDFVTGLIDIARRGRSLGVHLILATQRPAGVVSAEIKSNTNLRIALRVTDANDSQDVIESSDAATISKSTPGRGYARLGHSSLIPFQSSRVGGRPRAAGERAAVQARAMSWESLTDAPSGLAEAGEGDVGVASDLATLVSALGEAARIGGVQPPPSPWLAPLPAELTLDDASVPTDGAAVPPLAFGLVDLPSQQRRDVATWNPETQGHLAVIGAPRSGRSTALRAIAGAVARSVSPRDLHLYGVDCGNNALLPLVSLPHTGAVVTRDQVDRLSRLTARLLQTISSRQQLLAERGFADVREQRAHSAAEERLPYVVVLFDRWEGFLSAFESVDGGRLVDDWMQILQEGGGAGVRVVLTADRTALVGRLSTLIDDKLVLRLVDASDFAAIGLPAKQVPDAMPPGRGFRSDGVRETQVALLAADPAGTAQVAALQELGRRAAAQTGELRGIQLPFRVDALPARITLRAALELPGLALPAEQLPIGVGGDSLTLLGFDPIEHGPGLLVAGPRRSGRSTALCVLASAAAGRGWSVVAVTPRQSPLRDIASVTVFDLYAERDRVTAAVQALLADEHSLFAIDDLELVGGDGWLADLITEHTSALRDRAALVVGAGAADEMTGVYRGPTVTLKKSRSGLLLAPQTQSEGDLFGIRLPRSALGGAMLPGRGVLVRAGGYVGVQAVLP